MDDIVEIEDFQQSYGAAQFIAKPEDEEQERGTLPLASFLALYLRAHPKDVYCDWFRGTRLLVKWLGLPALAHSNVPSIPPFFATYEIQQLAKLLDVPYAQVHWACWNILGGAPCHSNLQ